MRITIIDYKFSDVGTLTKKALYSYTGLLFYKVNHLLISLICARRKGID